MTEFIESPYDGTRIPVTQTCATHGRGAVHVLLHGLGTSKDEYLNFYGELAARMAMRGHSSVRFDFRSHGDSSASESEFTTINCMLDALAVVEWTKRRFPGHKLALFGTSFGASIALLVANVLQGEIIRMNLLAPVLDYDRLYIHPTSKSRRARFGGMLRQTGVEGVPYLATDELNFHQRMVVELSAISIPAIIPQISANVEIMHGTADETVPASETKRAVGLFKHARLSTFAGMEHGFTKAGDEAGTDPASLSNLDRITDIAMS